MTGIGQVAVANDSGQTPTVPTSRKAVNYVKQEIPGLLTRNQQTYRGDQTLGKLGSVFFRFTHANYVNHARITPDRSCILRLRELSRKPETSWEVSHTVNFGQ